MKLFKKKPNTSLIAEEEVKRCYDSLGDKKPDEDDYKKVTENIERIRKAEESRYGRKVRLDPNKVCETIFGTLVPTLVVVHAEKLKDIIITSKAWAKIKFK